MVDFNNEATIGTPAADVEKISILQRRYDVIEAYEAYKKGKFMGHAQSLSIVKARLISLFIEIQAMLKRRLPKEEYDKLNICMNSTLIEEDILNILLRLNEFLDELKLTRIDTKKVYDSTDVEVENEEKDY